jgi:hypothetical protein
MTMIRMELDLGEAKALADVLTEYLSELRMEVSGTDLQDYREKLKRKEVFLKEILVRLGQPSAA